MTEERQYVTLEQAAALLGVSASTMFRLLRDPKGPQLKRYVQGRRTMLDRREVEQLAEHRNEIRPAEDKKS